MVLTARCSASRSATGSKAQLLGRTALAGLAGLLPVLAVADPLPTGEAVRSGDVTIARPTDRTMTIDQASDRAIVDWRSFSIGSGASVDIRQPDRNSAILNRVTGDADSRIHGRLSANGQVTVVNPNGIFIGANGEIQTGGGFVASTLDISNKDFNAGELTFGGNGSSATVTNRGTISVGQGGFAALLGGRVSNEGSVTVPMGRIAFGSGERATLDITGDGFLQIAVPTEASDAETGALIENAGNVSAEGGLIEMRAATARDAARNAINLSGVAEARSVSVRNGTILLGGGAGGTVSVSGTLSTRTKPNDSTLAVSSSLRPAPRPSSIEIAGASIALAGATVDASGSSGGGTVRIGGDFGGARGVQAADMLSADASTVIRADALESGDGGRIVLWSDIATGAAASLSAKGGASGGNGGFIEVSSAGYLSFAGLADTRAENGDWGTLLLDPRNIRIVEDSVGGTGVLPETGSEGELIYNDSLVAESVVEGNLASNDSVLIDTTGSASEEGNISLEVDLDWTTAATLEFYAHNDITLDGAINGPNGEFVLNAGMATPDDPSDGLITPTANGSVNVGTFVLENGYWHQNAEGGTLADFNVNSALETEDDVLILRVLDGDGSAADPYVLTDVWGLQAIYTFGQAEGPAGNVTDAYVLGNDIDATDAANYGGFVPLVDFAGVLDGDGHTISNLTYDTTDGISGLFEAILLGGEVRNLTLENAVSAGASVGGLLAGLIGPTGTVRNVRVSGTITSADRFALAYIGGLAGMNFGTVEATVVDANVNAAVNSSASPVSTFLDFGVDAPNWLEVGGVAGVNLGTIRETSFGGSVAVANASSLVEFVDVGGIAGDHGGDQYFTDLLAFVNTVDPGSPEMVIRDSYSRGSISASDSSGEATVTIGGISGWTSDDVETSFAASPLSFSGSDVNAGGLIGTSVVTSDHYDTSFWDVDVSGLSSSEGGTGLSTAEFQDQATFRSIAGDAGWDFDGVWAPGFDGNYPELYALNDVDVPPLAADGDGDLLIEAPDPLAEAPLPNPEDETGTGDEADAEETAAAQQALADAEQTLSQVQTFSAQLQSSVTNCGPGPAGGVDAFLACLSNGLGDFAAQLDSISTDLPPGMENVGSIVQTARADIEAIRQTTQAQLAQAATDAQRTQIAEAAVDQAVQVLNNAAAEVRNSFDLLQAGNDDLADVQQETVETVAVALEGAGTELLAVTEI